MDKVTTYVKDAYHELLHKVTWPTWEELQSSSIVVIIASVIITMIIFIMDFIFGANPENTVFQGILAYIYDLIN